MRKPAILFFVFVWQTLCLNAGEIQLPIISDLSSDNHIFQQYCDDVLYARKALAGGKSFSSLPIHFYRYSVKKEDTVIKIAARCSIPYDAIITLNSIESIATPLTGRMIMLPTLPALYLPEKASSDIEKLTEALCKKMTQESFSIKVPQADTGGKKVYRCIPNALLDSTVRNFFLMSRYRFPLKTAVVTSPFGVRKSPFTGKKSYHAGIDLAAPSGSPIYACTSGQIIKIAYSNVYGNYIILRHDDGRESLYGHLSAVKSRLYQKVKSGTIIGNVGSTGMSTGPHLHFEIREQGKAKNPVLFINTKQ
ncbi:MAG: LysM peptidoglycan-binding domain-containing M23 family metallopeptidase [Treponema sp.]